MPQLTTLTFFKYTSFRQKYWAFKMMRDAHRPLSETKGLQFYKLLGSGRGMGFNPFPDWSTYGLLQVWEEEARATEFFHHSELFQQYKVQADTNWTLYLRPIQVKGTWSGGNPFEIEDVHDSIERVAVITRATIRWSRMLRFWRYVPQSQKPLLNAPGLEFTKGVGEAPFVQMATFSLWKDLDSLRAFAYESKEHAKAIQLTRKLDWYKEEMFTRFQVIREEGGL